MSKSAMIMNCPECGHRDAHSVVKTVPVGDSNCYHMLSPIADCTLPSTPSTSMWPIYRVRYKYCANCKKEFETAEMPGKYYDALVRENKRYKEAEKLSTEDKLLIEVLTNKLNKISKIVGEGEVVAEGNISKKSKFVSLFGDSAS